MTTKLVCVKRTYKSTGAFDNYLITVPSGVELVIEDNSDYKDEIVDLVETIDTQEAWFREVQHYAFSVLK